MSSTEFILMIEYQYLQDNSKNSAGVVSALMLLVTELQEESENHLNVAPAKILLITKHVFPLSPPLL